MNRRAVWGRLLLGVLCMACLGWGRSMALRLEALPESRLLVMSSLTGREARDMLDAEQQGEYPASFALWGQRDAQGVQNPELERYASVNVLLLAGSSSVVYQPDAPLPPDDLNGCLIDPATAQALFGNAQPLGCTLEWNGRALTVRGVLDSGRPLLLAQALDSDGGLDHISLQPPEGQSVGRVVSEFESRHGLFGTWSNPGSWTGLAGFASLLPVLLALGYVLIKIIKTAFSAGQYPVVFLVCLLAAGAVWWVSLLAAGVSVGIPADMLPSKWSDFEFWGRLFAEKKEELMNLLAASKTEVELAHLLPALLAGGAGLAGSVLAAAVIMKIRPENGLQLWLCCAGSLAASFLLSLWLGGGLARDRALWLAPTLYFGARWLAEKLEEWAAEVTDQSTI